MAFFAFVGANSVRPLIRLALIIFITLWFGWHFVCHYDEFLDGCHKIT